MPIQTNLKFPKKMEILWGMGFSVIKPWIKLLSLIPPAYESKSKGPQENAWLLVVILALQNGFRVQSNVLS